MSKILIMSIIVLVVIAVISIGYFVNKQPVQDTKEPIKIGVIAPLSGNLAVFGEWISQGLKIAQEEINKKGINGRKIKLIYEDAKCSPQETTTALNKLVNIDNVVAFIGPLCGGSVAVATEIAESANVVGITPSHNFGNRSEYFISTQALLSDEGKAMARFTTEKLGAKTVAVFYHNNDFGKILKDSFKKEFGLSGGKVVAVEPLVLGQTDFRTELTKIKAKNPEVLYVVYSALGNIVNQAKELDLDVQVLGQTGTETPALLEVAKENADGIIYTHKATPIGKMSEKQKRFEEAYVARYGEKLNFITPESYDALMILVKAISVCSGQECLKDNILSTEAYDGVSGIITIDRETHAVDKPFTIKTIKNGEFVLYDK